MMNIAIRADGGPDIGMGHIVRCLALANEFKRQGHRVIFYSNLKQGIKRIKQEGFSVLELAGEIQSSGELNFSLEQEAQKLVYSIQRENIEYLIIDSYNINESYLLNLRKEVRRLIYIDDINKFRYPVDVLINYNINAEELGYDEYDENQTSLLGTKYALLRNQFQNMYPKGINEKVNEIMITSGGSDTYGMCWRILDTLLQTEEFNNNIINVIVRDGFENIEKINNAAEKNNNVVLHRNIDDISDIMKRSDIAISAGGSTLYELCACGTPTIAYIIADNQKGLTESMNRQGYIDSIGWYNEFEDENLKDKVLNLSKDYDRRRNLSVKMQKLVDGQGARRAADIILGTIK